MKIDTARIFQSKIFKGLLIGLATLIILLAAFKAGTLAGFHKADFSCRWSDNYHRNFGGPKGGFFDSFGDRDFIEASGTFGQIIKIDGSTLVVKGQGGVEKTILVNEKTTIKSLRQTIQLTDLKVDDNIVTIGEPNQAGQIEAKLIRVMPAPPKPGVGEPAPPKPGEGEPAPPSLFPPRPR